mmetsp:Transcript_16184/g.24431  ORF Transcript_16184/g.24431 Transcript_16184/m.24431 type:complete len:110 (+) Transcript_16184:357-686(+)
MGHPSVYDDWQYSTGCHPHSHRAAQRHLPLDKSRESICRPARPNLLDPVLLGSKCSYAGTLPATGSGNETGGILELCTVALPLHAALPLGTSGSTSCLGDRRCQNYSRQ